MNPTFPTLPRVSRLLAILLCASALAACDRSKPPEELLAEARSAFERNDLQTTAIQLKNLLQKDPSNAAARYELGRLHLLTGDAPSAVKELTRALDAGHPADLVSPLLARAMVEAGESKQAIERLGTTKLPTPAANADLRAAIGHAQLAVGNKDGAKAAFDEVLSADPNHLYAALGKARLLGTQREFAGAHALLDKVLTADPKSAEAWFLDAELRSAQGQFEQSLASYRKVYEVKPSNVTARFVVVSALANEGKVEEARKELAALRKASPKAPEANYLDGLLLVKERKFVEARDRLNKTLAVAPNYVPALGLAALTEFELQSYALAEQHAEKVIAHGGDSMFIRKVLIGAYLRTGRLDKARQALAPLLKSSPGNPEVQALAGQVYLTGGDAKGAEAAFEIAAKKQTEDADAQSRLGLSRLAAGDREGGIAALEQAVRLDAASGRPDLVLIVAHLRNRDADRALAAIDALEKKRQSDPVSINLRGTAYLLKNDPDRARAEFKRALDVDPAYFSAANNLARMYVTEDKIADAEAVLQQFVAKSPKSADALMALAGLKARTPEGMPDSLKLLRQAIDANPKEVNPRLALIELHQLAGDRGKALAAANEALNEMPDDPRVLDALALAQARAGEMEASVATRTKLVERDPSSVRAQLNLAATQVAAKRDAEAIQTLRKVLALQPETVEAQNMLITIHRSRNAIDEALRVARDVQRQRPKAALGYVMEGELMMASSKADQAIKAYREALSRERTATNVTRLHAALERDDKAADARALVDGWLKDNPKDVEVLLYLGDVALVRKAPDEARTRYEAALARSANNVIALNNLAWIAAQQKDPKARSYAEKAHSLAPRNPAVLDTYGGILLAAGETERGLQMMRQAVAAAPFANDLRLNLARGLAGAGRKDDARKELEPLVALGSKYERAAEVADLMKTL
ncbi:XrtA/PEP-CTERM system TPR-repeat protein PrsT [Methyloversatilis discipulorum]|uniref:XrtA/PEP-CTERM system TPR-repeat protein PrsT n=1 Tax=Methyloversatilis discipulorum TaxID=1119528 RepID=UPI001A569805|nr:XrtA/PEP-CTERM system TPR-repeat protein PrsT [Methyloversatilis discipulorum]MBL8467578.1 PEP-CTERM system TPR-repeat protein PrsT [Methyloversatilis discipulorum]